MLRKATATALYLILCHVLGVVCSFDLCFYKP